jgi:hypothetical protein
MTSATLRQRGFDGRTRRAVEIPVHLGPFEQVVGRAQPFEFLLRLEVVVDAVDFAGAARARRDRDRQRQVQRLVEQTDRA